VFDDVLVVFLEYLQSKLFKTRTNELVKKSDSMNLGISL
jgi:hypothetical protein